MFETHLETSASVGLGLHDVPLRVLLRDLPGVV